MGPPLVDQFEQLWKSAEPTPDVFAFLASCPAGDLDTQVEVLLKDQEFRWQTARPLIVEAYLAQLPSLAGDPNVQLRLAVGEFHARQQSEILPSIEEYASRFPEIGDLLRATLSEAERTGTAFLASTATASELIDFSERQIGRYRLVRILGEGGYGCVWLGIDEELRRPVAIKVPRQERFQDAEDIGFYLAEARAVAELDHPQIVPVYDVGRTETGSVYIVSKFIKGQTLKDLIKDDRPGPEESARLIAILARALQHAHDKGLIHRDIKPSNILFEAGSRTPYLADFGLAIKEADFIFECSVAGTPAYMSPEQARGEGHRLDGRSDLFSLGIVFYELLTGKRLFTGSTRNEILHQVISVDPVPPREIDSAIPAELERICLKALSKRASARYASASELADELSSWQLHPHQFPQERAIVPRGLRSFDADHAEFFLDLLPGPKSRDGLPESVRFWKHRLEETDPDKTFSVGLIYGPSGCGKSSLVKAGLLPRLSPHLASIYIESTAEETETRLLVSLRKTFSDLPKDLSLAESLAILRRGSGPKIVLVLDQFEQWLYARKGDENAELVSALRQCDGGRLQAVVMVRDDFWMAVSRFMADLEVDIVQGHNTAAFDLFSLGHAEYVLKAFGLGYQAIRTPLSPANEAFIKESVRNLAEDGQVVPVRLALFGEMVKNRDWALGTLKDIGGMEGVGVTFLEETFTARTANPHHRLHEKAARQVLGALLPEVGTDIKGHMRPQADLRLASGYQDRPRDFGSLMRILDGELRLITPTDPFGPQSESGKDTDQKHYQLTHDYLVPSLRSWLTRKQKETWKGRAELQLSERAAEWSRNPINRRLPKWWEHLNIRLFTKKRSWSDPERRMMRAAAKVHGLRFGLLFAILLILGVGIEFYVSSQKENLARHKRDSEQQQSDLLVDAVLTAPAAAVPYAIRNLLPFQEYAIPALKTLFDNDQADSNTRLRAAVTLAEFGEVHADYFISAIESAERGECDNIVNALSHDRDYAVSKLRDVIAEAHAKGQWKQKARYAVCLLHLGETSRMEEMFQIREDPIQRTWLIETLRQWHGPFEPLLKVAANFQSGAFRSGVCAGLGGIPRDRIPAHRFSTALPVFEDWYASAPDSGTHSAAEWALRQWESPLPDLKPTPLRAAKSDWSLNSLDMVMIRIPPKIESAIAPRNPGDSLEQPFWIGDREVSVGQFETIRDEASDLEDGFLSDWKGPDTARSPTLEHPVQQVSWEDAVQFCNWLSKREGRPTCYRLEGTEWVLDQAAKGYRLPTEKEWQQACCAGAVTDFFCGNDENFLPQYAVILSYKTERCGSRLPNGWGLFDTHGNVYELTQDRFPKDPNKRVLKSGAFDYAPGKARWHHKEGAGIDYRSYTIGFRVARSAD